MDVRNMQRREINRDNEQICAHSWIYLRDYTGMRGQQNKIAYRLYSFITGSEIYLASPVKIYLPIDRFTRTHSYKWAQ